MRFNILLKNRNGTAVNQFIATLAAVFCSFVNGLFIGWPSPSLPKILSPEYTFDVSNDEASYIATISSAGNIIGILISCLTIDVIGRKKCLLFIGIPQMISFFLISLSFMDKSLLFIGRFLGGIGEGIIMLALPMYISEIAQPEIRGKLAVFVAITFTAGLIFINIIGSYITLYAMAAICTCFPIIFFATFSLMPETPYFYLMKDRKEAAKLSLECLRNSNNVDKELHSLNVAIKRQISEPSSYRDLFLDPANRKALILMIVLRFFQQFTGCSAFNMYAQLLFKDATDFIEPHVGVLFLQLAQLFAVSTSSYLADRKGRKPLLFASVFGTFLMLVLQGTYFAIKDYTQLDVAKFNWLPLVFLFIFNICFHGGFGCLIGLIISEMFSASIKPKAVAVVSMCFALFLFSSTKLYQVGADALGAAVPFYFFAACSLVACVFVKYVLIETKNKSLEQIQWEIKGIKVTMDESV